MQQHDSTTNSLSLQHVYHGNDLRLVYELNSTILYMVSIQFFMGLIVNCHASEIPGAPDIKVILQILSMKRTGLFHGCFFCQ
jgi:G:T-mismatch repair DNA endonuclease (very short patch repair protein)